MGGEAHGGGPNGERQKKREYLKPSKWLEVYSGWAYKRPVTMFLVIVVVVILLAVAAVASNSFSISDGGSEWTVKTNEHSQRDEAITQAEEQLASQIDERKRSQDNFALKLAFIYKDKTGGMNMFTQENLEIVREVENTLLRNPMYRDFCELDYTDVDNPTCITQLSPLGFFFDFSESDGYGAQINSPEEGLALLNQDIFVNGFYVVKEFPENNNASSLYTQSLYSFGLPIDKYNNSKDDDDDQIDFVYDNFLKDVEEDLWELLGMEKANFFRTKYSDTGSLRTVEVVWGTAALEAEEFLRVIFLDFTWAGLSLVGVWLYLMFHLGSFFLSIVGAFEIFFAFPAGAFIYRQIFGIEFFAQLHILVIFILLGLGADDVFVFTDAFKQSESMPGVGINLQDRLQYTAHRASKAVFVTSFTTAAAFFASATSELMPMASFGIFAGLCIVILFLFNVLIMPCALVLWAGYTPYCVKRVCCCCIPLCKMECIKNTLPCCTCCHIEPDKGFDIKSGRPLSVKVSNTVDGPVSPESGVGTGSIEGGVMSAYSAPEKQLVDRPPIRRMLTMESVAQMRPLERFFNGPYFRFLKVARWAIIAIGAVMFGLGLYYITEFSPPKESEQWWPSYHSFQKLADLRERGGPFLSRDEDAFSKVHLAWGLKGFDTSSRNIWDSEDFGTLEYDEAFDMSSPEAQTHLLGVCPRAREAPCTASACDPDDDGNRFLVRFDRSVPDSFEPCWIEDFNIYVQTNLSDTYPNGLPVDQTDFLPALRGFMNTPEFLLRHQGKIGLFRGDTPEQDELRYIQFELTSTYRPPTAASTTRPVLDSWEDFMDAVNADARAAGLDEVSNGFQTGRAAWVWLFSQESLVDSAIQGIFIVFAIAFVILNVASGNVIISIIAITTVAGIVATVMGVCVSAMMGWEFGVAESIVSVILIGFSMDYSLHLADSYIESERTSRMDRTQDALTRLGISVTAGAITTLISGVFLWGAILTFFTKFAFMITATIVVSYLWSMLFFPSMAMTFGPEGNWGDWSTLITVIKGLCCGGSAPEGSAV
ncbi:unnamed protein product [Ostreobium quekettii]|uniref:SSD domain-containing protein n=1 Tax=Ostreobium quekettii TaxID=121088 RepID=A0A8S1IW52_9CHLO|nr:unnamed protein product [Ostreobium quekettii]|eukprot:evm.model.scf_1146EXC.5 EVM.evm.TU.scf_1146EXC.5   scf_1146EXC:28416-41363(-)